VTEARHVSVGHPLPAGLAAAVAALDPAALLPSRRAGEGHRLRRPLTLRAALELPALELPGGADRAGDTAGPATTLAALVSDAGAALVAAPLVIDAGEARRAVPGDGAAAALVRLVREHSQLPPGMELVRLAPLAPAADSNVADQETGIAADQTHDSVVVSSPVATSGGRGQAGGPAVVVKWAVHVEATTGEPAAVRAVRRLHRAGFAQMPEPYGFLVAHDGGAAVLLASLARYLPEATDGWHWCVGDLTDLVQGRVDRSASLQPAAELGGLVARMHLAFAAPDLTDPALAEPVSSAGGPELAAWSDRALDTLDEAIAVTGGSAGRRLRRRAASARAQLAALTTLVPAQTPVTAIHGDLHVGQVLRWGGGYAVSDFDGNPVRPAGERVQRQPPARDVAGMLRALDHVGRIVLRRLAVPTHPVVDEWIRAASEAFVAAYRAGLGEGGAAALFDPRLLPAFEVEQECRELVYAARHLPGWTYVPDSALGPLLSRLEQGGVQRARGVGDQAGGAT